MAGTKIGGKNAAKTIKAKYGKDYYARIGSKGGKIGTTGGFYANSDFAREAGRKGGRKSSNSNFYAEKRRKEGKL